MSALRDILASEPPMANDAPPPPPPPPPPASSQPAAVPPGPAQIDKSSLGRQREGNAETIPRAAATAINDGAEPSTAAPTTTPSRRGQGGAVSTLYSGSRMRHLKKEDGMPLWRKDIQYDFLQLIFSDTTKCFTKYSDGTKNHTFASVYIDAMAKSSNCSKILKEKLLQDHDGAVCTAMVCLLVNVGRMNTTLNFFPEMRAQLRTYHPIPALQARQDPTAYKQLQDAPRLKSILKGATEDTPQPATIDEVIATPRPRTNPVNLIFIMVSQALKLSEMHFQMPRDFFDLVMRPTLSSESRARAFLWLMWWYLESDFSYEDSQQNPFGPGQYPDGDMNKTGVPMMVPPLDSLTEEQAATENTDPPDEIAFGEAKRKERAAILVSDPSPAMIAPKRSKKDLEKGIRLSNSHTVDSGDETIEHGPKSILSSRHGLRHVEAVSDYTRSPSPATGNAKVGVDMRIDHLLNNDEDAADASPSSAAAPVKKGPGRGNWRRSRVAKKEALAAAAAASTKRGHEDRAQPVPLLPNTRQLNFVNDTPGHARPATPGSSAHQVASGLAMSPHNGHDHIPTPSYQAQKRQRGVTQHQSALINHRRMQIEYTLDQRIRDIHIAAREAREAEGSILRAWKRIRTLPPDYDSEEEEAVKSSRSRNKDRTDRDEEGTVPTKHRSAGKENDSIADDNNTAINEPRGSAQPRRLVMAGFARVPGEPNDVGEEAKSLARAFRRASRRLERWSETDRPGDALIQRREMRERELSSASKRPGSPMSSALPHKQAMHTAPSEHERGRSRGRKSGEGLAASSAAAGAAATTTTSTATEDLHAKGAKRKSIGKGKAKGQQGHVQPYLRPSHKAEPRDHSAADPSPEHDIDPDAAEESPASSSDEDVDDYDHDEVDEWEAGD